MAKWQRTLDIRDVWDSGDIPLVANIAADRLAHLARFDDENLEDEKQNLADELRDLSEDPKATANDFDDVWSRVYDWADRSLDSQWNGRKVCWIKTF
jgi:hypothetical protein